MNPILDEHLIEKKQQSLLGTKSLIIWGILLFLGLFFKFSHWPGASIIILFSSGGLTASSFSGLIPWKEKNSFTLITGIAGLIWMIVLISGVLFRDGHPYNENGLMIYGLVFGTFFLIYELMKRRRRRNTPAN